MKKNCDCCSKLIYNEEFYLADNGEIVCSSCLIDKEKVK